MAVRRQINRYKTEPFGRDFNEVLRKGKRFHSIVGEFMMVEYFGVWTAAATVKRGATPKGAIIFKKMGRKWAHTEY